MGQPHFWGIMDSLKTTTENGDLHLKVLQNESIYGKTTDKTRRNHEDLYKRRMNWFALSWFCLSFTSINDKGLLWNSWARVK